MGIFSIITPKTVLKAVKLPNGNNLQYPRVVDDQPEVHAEGVCRGLAQAHSRQEYLELFHNGADLQVDLQREDKLLFVVRKRQRRAFNGVVHAVVDIGGRSVARDRLLALRGAHAASRPTCRR